MSVSVIPCPFDDRYIRPQAPGSRPQFSVPTPEA